MVVSLSLVARGSYDLPVSTPAHLYWGYRHAHDLSKGVLTNNAVSQLLLTVSPHTWCFLALFWLSQTLFESAMIAQSWCSEYLTSWRSTPGTIWSFEDVGQAGPSHRSHAFEGGNPAPGASLAFCLLAHGEVNRARFIPSAMNWTTPPSLPLCLLLLPEF